MHAMDCESEGWIVSRSCAAGRREPQLPCLWVSAAGTSSTRHWARVQCLILFVRVSHVLREWLDPLWWCGASPARLCGDRDGAKDDDLPHDLVVLSQQTSIPCERILQLSCAKLLCIVSAPLSLPPRSLTRRLSGRPPPRFPSLPRLALTSSVLPPARQRQRQRQHLPKLRDMQSSSRLP